MLCLEYVDKLPINKQVVMRNVSSIHPFCMSDPGQVSGMHTGKLVIYKNVTFSRFSFSLPTRLESTSQLQDSNLLLL